MNSKGCLMISNIFRQIIYKYYQAGNSHPGKDRLTYPLRVRRHNQLIGLDRNVTCDRSAMLTGHCVMGRHAVRLRHSTKDFCD